MSSFKDTFTRDQGGENNLQYDDTAFYYFFLTILALSIIPLIISIFRQIFFNSEVKKIKTNCPCLKCKSKTENIKKEVAYSWISKSLFFKVNIRFRLLLIFLSLDCGIGSFMCLFKRCL